MTGKLFIFIAGSFSSLFWSNLPTILIIWLLITLVLLMMTFSLLPTSNIVTTLASSKYFLLGVIWMASVGHWQCSLQLSLTQISQPIVIQGKVISLLQPNGDSRFNLSVTHIDRQALYFARKMRLSWRQPGWQLAEGQTVRLLAKVKPIHGLANEAGFNYQQWLFSEGIYATGYVKPSETNDLLDDTISVRQQLLDQILAMPLSHKKWLLALSIGYRGLLSTDDWQLVQNTGIAHLIAISGLHLGLVASLSYWVIGWLLGCVISRVNSWHGLNLHKTSLIVTVFTTLGYAAIAGFGLPSVRAWIMLCLFTVVFIRYQYWTWLKVLALAICCFVLVFPLSIFGASFWLSFAAVITISFIFWRWPIKQATFSLSTMLLTMIRVQLGLSLLMLPVVAWQFSYVSLSAPIVNLVAVPVVTFLLVPLCLLGTIFVPIVPDWAFAIFKIADSVLLLGINGLERISHWQYSALDIPAIPTFAWLLVMLAMLFLCIPYSPLSRKYAVLLLVPIVSYLFKSNASEWQLDVLDVGQGVSVLVTRHNRALLYDVGASYPSGFNMADSVILPVLKSRGIYHLDYVFISHGDNDHAGSLEQLKAGVSIGKLLTNQDLCGKGMNIRWQQLDIIGLWPDSVEKYSSNNGSCVISISDGVHRVLLSGDIDKSIEHKLVAQYGNQLASHVLLAPHHGSNTSSSSLFIDRVHPQHVVFSQSFMNRWQFPRAEVVTRYLQWADKASSLDTLKLYQTSVSGQVSFVFKPNDKVGGAPSIAVAEYRQDRYSYWYANMPACCEAQ